MKLTLSLAKIRQFYAKYGITLQEFKQFLAKYKKIINDFRKTIRDFAKTNFAIVLLSLALFSVLAWAAHIPPELKKKLPPIFVKLIIDNSTNPPQQ